MAEKDVTVTVVLNEPGSNPPFHFKSHLLTVGKNNRLTFDNVAPFHGFRIDFELDDTNNPGFRFPTRQTHGNDFLKEAMWVTTGDTCPTSAMWWDQFQAKDVEDGGKTLEVKNRNDCVQDFFYTLRVFKGSTELQLDPGGTNKNGGVFRASEQKSSTLLVGGVALVVGALIGAFLIAPALK